MKYTVPIDLRISGIRRILPRQVDEVSVAPSNHVAPIREILLGSGAGYILVLGDDVMTLSGLPRHPAGENIHIHAAGEIDGLF